MPEFPNDELINIEQFLPKAISALKQGGRLAIITFHSLEDRLVKKYFIQEAKDCICSDETPVCVCDHSKQIRIINRKVIKPAIEEINKNKRARSAKLRIIEKL